MTYCYCNELKVTASVERGRMGRIRLELVLLLLLGPWLIAAQLSLTSFTPTEGGTAGGQRSVTMNIEFFIATRLGSRRRACFDLHVRHTIRMILYLAQVNGIRLWFRGPLCGQDVGQHWTLPLCRGAYTQQCSAGSKGRTGAGPIGTCT